MTTDTPQEAQEIDAAGMRALLAHQVSESLKVRTRVDDLEAMVAKHRDVIEQVESSRFTNRLAMMLLAITEAILVLFVLRR